MAGESASGYQRGGMVTKIEAAQIAIGAGCRMVIAKGELQAIRYRRLPRSKPATGDVVPAARDPVTARKRWIAGTLEPKGAVIVDDGAAQALARGQEPVAGRRHRGRGRFRARRCGRSSGPATGREIGRGSDRLWPDEAKRHHRPQEQ